MLATTDPAAVQSVADGIGYLNRVMDAYQDRFPVYEDVSSPGNHFHAWGKIADNLAAVQMSGSSTVNPHDGATAIRAEFDVDATKANYGGFYLLNGVLPPGAMSPELNFGTVPNAGIDLSGATSLTFWARGESGGEVLEFFVGGVGRDAQWGYPTAPYPDSSPRTPALGTTFRLSTAWQQFTISLAGRNMSYLLGGFGWVANAPNNPHGAVFYLDDIAYHLDTQHTSQRLDDPRFLRSFTTAPIQPNLNDANVNDDIDLVLRNAASTYDNSLVILAYLADGSADSLRRARLIGDALVYAAAHDRTYDDGRLRSFYAAGDLVLPPGWTPNNRVGTVAIPGYYTEPQTFHEIEQGSVDTGNNAWAMIALLALYQRTGNASYLETARGVGRFIQSQRQSTGQYQGFLGGIDNAETPTPTQRNWASAEHNLDVVAAFTRMAELTGEAVWRDDAAHAADLVDAMWDNTPGDYQQACYLTGTSNPNTSNIAIGQLPLDVQAWSQLAATALFVPHPEALACAEAHHRTTEAGFSGYDFNDDQDGVWPEGTGQMTVAYAHDPAAAGLLRQTLRGIQQLALLGETGSLPAALHDGLSTGFGFSYFARPAIAPTAWNVFAQLKFNPYYKVSINAVPTISSPADQATYSNLVSLPIDVTVGDEETPAANLTLTAVSSDPILVPVANITFGGAGANRTVSAKPAPNRTGTATITVTVSDGTDSVLTTFQLTVQPNLHPWHNPRTPEDVNMDLVVTAVDVLAIVNMINSQEVGGGQLPIPPSDASPPPPFYDVNEDDHVAPIDVLIVINYINLHSGVAGEGESAAGLLLAGSRLEASAPTVTSMTTVEWIGWPRLLQSPIGVVTRESAFQGLAAATPPSILRPQIGPSHPAHVAWFFRGAVTSPRQPIDMAHWYPEDEVPSLTSQNWTPVLDLIAEDVATVGQNGH